MRAKLAADLGGCDLSALPLREGYTPPSQEEKDMRARCSALLERGRNATAAFNDDLSRGRDTGHGGVTRRLGADAALEATSRHHCEQVAAVLEELRGEDAALYDAVASPIAAALASLSPQLAKRFGPAAGLPPGGLIDIDLSDLEANLNSMDAAAMYDFCIDKLTEFAAERADPAACASGEAIEDVDLFALAPYEGEAPDSSEPSVFVNAKWLRHLEQRQMGDSGRICRVTAAGLEPEEAASSGGSEGGAPKAQAPCVDCPSGGLVLDWVFGKIVNTAEKARSGAQTSLAGSPMAGMPGKALRHEELRSAADSAYNALKRGCLDHGALAEQRAQAKALLADALRARLAAEQAGVPALVADAIASAGAAAAGGAPRAAATATSPATIAVALAQEDVLCAVKIMLLSSEAASHAAAVRAAHAKVTRGHPEYRRLQAELEELDAKTAAAHANPSSGGSGDDHSTSTGATTAAERAQLMSQLAQRSSSLNALVESRDAARTAGEIAQREVHRLETWRHTLKALGLDAAGPDPGAASAAVARFDADVLRQLYTPDMGRQLFDQLKARVKEWDRKAERCAATLCHSEARLVNLCAVDPGAPIGQHLVLPALQDRIFKAAELRAAAKALEAEAAVAEEGARERAAKEAAEAAARRKREVAAAKAAAARAKKLASNGGTGVQGVGGAGASALHDRASSPDDVQQRQDAQAKAHAEKLAARRAAEDAALEARRLELMAEGGHWKERADAVAAEAALLKAAADDNWHPAKSKAADAQEVAPPAPRGRQAGGTKHGAGAGGGGAVVSNVETVAPPVVSVEKEVADSGSNVTQAPPPPPVAQAASVESAVTAPAAVVQALVPPPAKVVMVTSPLPASAISAPPFQAPSMTSGSGVMFQGAAAVAMARAEVMTALQAARAAAASLAAMPPALREVAAADIGAAVNSLAKASAALALAH